MASGKIKDFSGYENFFNRYCHDFTKLTRVNDPNIKLKKDHSLRVAKLARLLTEFEQFRAGPAFLTGVAALFHDIGRFEQYARYKTFKDSDSIDHARLGFKILGAQGFLDSLSVSDIRCIRLAVLFHNRHSLPSGLPREIDMVCKALRDADKLDIFPVMLSHFEPGSTGNSVVTLGLSDSDEITPEILDQLKSRRLGDYSRMQYLNDFKLLICSWVYDLNFSFSRRLVLKQRYIQKIFEMLPARLDLHGLKKRILKDLENGGRALPAKSHQSENKLVQLAD
ncbi:MAG: HD domain-containing protein [Desulfonatronovibrio sp.]